MIITHLIGSVFLGLALPTASDPTSHLTAHAAAAHAVGETRNVVEVAAA
jgi:hypothetical protein